MDKLNLAQLGEKLKTSGAQMGRIVSDKMKEILQTPTPESKMVDEATSETLEEPNWGMNLRICAMINSGEFNGSEIVKAIKKKISSKNPVSQRLSLDLLEACTMNCEKVFSEVASEKVLEDMVRMIDNPLTDHQNRRRALQLIRAWGESGDLAYLPVFRQTYMSLKGRSLPLEIDGENSAHVPYSLESHVHEDSLDPPESYPIPDAAFHVMNRSGFSSSPRSLSVEEKKEHLVIARNSLELLSTILNSGAEPKLLKEDVTVSLLEKCRQSLSVIKVIVESTADDEGTLFEALNLNDELQQVVSKYEESEAAQDSRAQPYVAADTTKHVAEAVQNPIGPPESVEGDEPRESDAADRLQRKVSNKPDASEVNSTTVVYNHCEANTTNCAKDKDAELSGKRDAE
ncbi:TOM1-like protein 2 [Prosopis cineraria]|uniref:TOM1-like protein 2 n=1 Tax=Prosopis cineraria TaxID=364024 RepID=UPI00241080A6|nr:TOM1-like protein 2 [Prosopis cineraria]